MRGRRKTITKLQFVDLPDLQKRVRKIQKRKAGIYARWRGTNPNKEK